MLCQGTTILIVCSHRCLGLHISDAPIPPSLPPSLCSSKVWLARQGRDQYVKQATVDQYRARSAYKLEEIDTKFKVFFRGANVVCGLDLPPPVSLMYVIPNFYDVQLDCGAAPGSWMQVALKRVGSPARPGPPAAAAAAASLQDPSGASPGVANGVKIPTGGIVIGIDLLSMEL